MATAHREGRAAVAEMGRQAAHEIAPGFADGADADHHATVDAPELRRVEFLFQLADACFSRNIGAGAHENKRFVAVRNQAGEGQSEQRLAHPWILLEVFYQLGVGGQAEFQWGFFIAAEIVAVGQGDLAGIAGGAFAQGIVGV